EARSRAQQVGKHDDPRPGGSFPDGFEQQSSLVGEQGIARQDQFRLVLRAVLEQILPGETGSDEIAFGIQKGIEGHQGATVRVSDEDQSFFVDHFNCPFAGPGRPGRADSWVQKPDPSRHSLPPVFRTRSGPKRGSPYRISRKIWKNFSASRRIQPLPRQTFRVSSLQAPKSSRNIS